APENDLTDRFTRQIADGSNVARFIGKKRVYRSQVYREYLVARGPRIGHERSIRFGATLIAQIYFGLFVAHAECGCGSELGRDSAQHRAFCHRKKARARAREFDDHGGTVLQLDFPNDVTEATAYELECHVARAHEGAHTPRKQDLHAAW